MAAAMFALIITVVCFYTVRVAVTEEFVNYVKPQYDDFSECPKASDPCLALGNYTQQLDTYFISNSKFIFLPGNHQMDSRLSLENLTNVTFQGDIDSNNRSFIVFAPLAHINWTDCTNISIIRLVFLLSGTAGIDNFFISMQFLRSVNSQLLEITFMGGQNHLHSTAVRCYESSINISNSNFVDCSSYVGAAIVGYSCSLYSDSNFFINNSAKLYGGAVVILQSKAIFTGRSSFINNIALVFSGGAITSYNSEVEIRGSSVFIKNSITSPLFGRGGALLSSDGKLHISGNAYFVNNSAGFQGGGLYVYNTSVNLNGDIYFDGNTALISGGGICLANNSRMYGWGLHFMNNHAFNTGESLGLRSGAPTLGGGISVFNGSHIYLVGAHFENNTASSGASILLSIISTGIFANITAVGNKANLSGGVIYVDSGSVLLIGRNYLISNSAQIFGGAIFTLTSEITFSGANYITGNTVPAAGGGGGVYFSFSNSTVSGVFVLRNNAVRYFGGAIYGGFSSITFQRGVVSLIEANSAESGGAIYTLDTSITLTGHQSFIGNSAQQGGALALLGNSKITIASPQNVNFINNRAESDGGAIFFADPISIRQCNKTDHTFNVGFCYDPTKLHIFPCSRLSSCFLEFELNFNDSHTLTFVNNTARRAGSILYGGQLDDCKLYLGGAIEDSCGNRIGGEFSENPIETLNVISYIDNEDTLTSTIASDPLQVCFCDNGAPDCTIERSVQTVTGRAFSLSLVTVGQGNFTVPSSVRVSLDGRFRLDPAQNIQETRKTCANVTYALYSNELALPFVLYPDGPCRDIGIARREVQVTFLPCPDGFMLSGVECVCEERLQPYTTNCNVNDSSIERKENNFWMKALYSNGTYQGLVIHPSRCPFDHCVNTPVTFTLTNLDAQCDHNRSGTLCGSCIQHLSLSLGSLHCLPCSNSYVLLILLFALAGVALVALLLLLRLTVAYGTLNGMVFYANMVQINRHVFFPLGETNILTVFIAWVNLDLGIETCFYDGMNVYMFTWFQYLFPFYVWFLVGLIIVLCHYSKVFLRWFGSNPIAVLSTLVFLSYTKILRTIIISLSYTSLEYPDGSYQKVWLSDGDTLYFKQSDHIVLGVFAVLMLVVFFLPYTFLMLFGHKLLAYSDKWVLSWMNKIMPFLDAYYASFKQEHRYWIGLILFIRCALFMTFALNTLGSASLNLVFITSVTAGLMGIAWVRGRVYLKLYNDILEASLILNLCIFAAATYHLVEIKGSQAGLAYASVGLVFVMFISVVVFHVYLQLKNSFLWTKLGLDKVTLPSCPSKPWRQKTSQVTRLDSQSRAPLIPTCTVISLSELTEYTA